MSSVSGGSLEFDAAINLGDFERDLARMQKGIDGLTDSQKRQSEGIESFAKKAATAAAGFLSIQAATGFVQSMVQVRGAFQQIEVAFTTMLKSKDAADKLMSQAVQLAAVTPFTLQEVASGAKQLLAYGVGADKVTKTLEMLGNVASGVGSDLAGVVYLYGTLKTSGRVTQMDINQFAGRGIPIYKALADTMKISVDQVRAYVSAGKIGFPQIEKAFQGMTGPAGQFFNLMQEQSKTLSGQLSNLSDAWDRMLNDLGKSNEGLFAGAIGGAIDLINNYQNIIDIIKGIIIVYGAYRAALLLTTIASTASGIAINLEAFAFNVLRNGVLSTIGSIEVFGTTTLAAIAPIAAMTAVLAALGAVLYSFIQFQNAEEIAQEAVNKAQDDGARSADAERGKIQGLISVIQSHTATKKDQKQAYDDLLAETGNYLKSYSIEEIAAGKAAGAIALFTGSIALATTTEKEYAAYKGLSEKLDELDKKGLKAVGTFDKLWQGVKDVFAPTSQGLSFGDWIGQFTSGGKADEILLKQFKDRAKKAQDLLLKQNPDIKKKIDAAKVIADAKKEQDDLQKQFKDLLAKGAIANFDELMKLAPDKAALEALQKAVTDVYESMAPGDKAKAGIKTKIQSVTKLIADSYGTSTKDVVKAADERKKFLENLSKLEAAGLSKSLDADAEALAAIHNKYEDQRKKATALGLGKGVIQRINNLEKTETGSLKYEQDTKSLKENLDKQKTLQIEYEAFVEKFGIDAAVTRYRELKDLSTSYYQQLTNEQKKITDIPEAKRTGNQNERLKVVNDLLIEEKKRQRAGDDERLADALDASATYDTKRLKLIDDYLKRKKIIETTADVTDRAARLDALELTHKEELQSLGEDTIRKLAVYKELSGDISKLNEAAARKDIASLQKTIDAALKAGKISQQVYNEFNKFTHAATQALDDRLYDKILQIANGLDQLAASASKLSQSFGNIVSSLTNSLKSVANIGKLSIALREATSTEEKFTAGVNLVAAGLSAVIDLVDVFVSSAKQRKDAEEAYYNSVIASQNQYNISLIDQIRLQEQLKGNIFLKDYKADILNASTALSKANKDFGTSLVALQAGQAKSGTHNAVDTKSIASGMVAGATAGAAIGGLIGTAIPIPIIGSVAGAVGGAIIGGIAGAIGGLFGGKKKVDTLSPLLKEFPELITKAKDGTDVFNEALAKNLIQNNLVSDSTKVLLQNTIDLNAARQAAIDQINSDIKDLAGSLGDDLRNSLVTAFQDGTDAAQAFGDSVGKVIENIVSQFLFNEIFGAEFTKLQESLQSSFGISGDQNATDDLVKFYQEAGPLVKSFQDALAAAKAGAADSGIDIFKPTGSSSSGSGSSISQGIQAITENQASELGGVSRGIQLNTYNIYQQQLKDSAAVTAFQNQDLLYSQQKLNYLLNIVLNTKRTADGSDQYLPFLKDIAKNTSGSDLLAVLRAYGI